MTVAPDEQPDHLSLDIGNPLIWPLVPVQAHRGVATLWALNRRLATMAAAPTEPMLRLIRLRWWADQLTGLDVTSRPPEPLLAEVANHLPRHAAAGLGHLAEAWIDQVDDEDIVDRGGPGRILFTLTGEVIAYAAGVQAIDAAGRLAVAGGAWGAIAHAVATGGPGLDWPALADQAAAVRRARLPRSLAALLGQAQSIARADGRRRPRREQMLILRIGLFGR